MRWLSRGRSGPSTRGLLLASLARESQARGEACLFRCHADRAPGHVELGSVDRQLDAEPGLVVGQVVDLDPELHRLLVPGDRQRARCRQLAHTDGPRVGDFDQDLGVTFGIEEVDRAEMTVSLCVLGLQRDGPDGDPPCDPTVARDRPLALDLLEPPRTVIAPQKCLTQNSAREAAGSRVQRPSARPSRRSAPRSAACSVGDDIPSLLGFYGGSPPGLPGAPALDRPQVWSHCRVLTDLVLSALKRRECDRRPRLAG